jgi:hypothetical protein
MSDTAKLAEPEVVAGEIVARCATDWTDAEEIIAAALAQRDREHELVRFLLKQTEDREAERVRERDAAERRVERLKAALRDIDTQCCRHKQRAVTLPIIQQTARAALREAGKGE